MSWSDSYAGVFEAPYPEYDGTNTPACGLVVWLAGQESRLSIVKQTFTKLSLLQTKHSKPGKKITNTVTNINATRERLSYKHRNIP